MSATGSADAAASVEPQEALQAHVRLNQMDGDVWAEHCVEAARCVHEGPKLEVFFGPDRSDLAINNDLP